MEPNIDVLSINWEGIVEGEKLKISKVKNQTIIEYTSQKCGALRVICYDEIENSFFMYTFDPNFVLIGAEAAKLLLYTNALNDILINTLVELDMQNFQFRYKSAQGFPPGVPIENLISKLIGIHDQHYKVIEKLLLDISTNSKTVIEFHDFCVKKLNQIKKASEESTN